MGAMVPEYGTDEYGTDGKGTGSVVTDDARPARRSLDRR
jgi:hypothetical protein